MRTGNKGRILIVVVMGLLTVMTGVCFADMGNPGGMLVLIPFMIMMYIYVITTLMTLLALITGLYLLIWRLLDPKPKCLHRIGEQLDIILSLFGGWLCSGIVIGIPIYFRALKRAAQIFFDDVRGNKEDRPKWNALFCVAGGMTVSVAGWLFALSPLSRNGIGYYKSLSVDFVDLFVYCLKKTGERKFDWIAVLACVLTLLWIVVLIVKHIGSRKVSGGLKSSPADEAAVFGLILLGYWWWYFGGVLFYLAAWPLAKSIMYNRPVQLIAVSGGNGKTEETPETTEALRKMQSLDGVIKKDGQSEDE